jgi:hypothetical protein
LETGESLFEKLKENGRFFLDQVFPTKIKEENKDLSNMLCQHIDSMKGSREHIINIHVNKPFCEKCSSEHIKDYTKCGKREKNNCNVIPPGTFFDRMYLYGNVKGPGRPKSASNSSN